MKPWWFSAIVVLSTFVVGCGSSYPAPDAEPLSVEEWKAMPKQKKYVTETLERLKAGNPELETAEGWEQFRKTTLLEVRRRDRMHKR